MIIKQCTKLLPYDTSLYTVYAVFDDESEGIVEINLRNDHISKELKVYLDEKGMVCTDNEVIKSIVVAMKDTSLLLCSETMEKSTIVLRTIGDIFAEDDIEPLFIEPHNDISTPSWEIALRYNHTVSAVGHGGFGGGIDSPAGYEVLKDVVSKKTYNKYVLSCCIDSRSLPLFWTPYSPDQKEKTEPVKSIEKDKMFKIEVKSTALHRKRLVYP